MLPSQISASSAAYLNNQTSNQTAPVEVESWQFLSQFNGTKQIRTDEIIFIDREGESISSIAMDDCITLFALEKGAAIQNAHFLDYSRLIGYHIASLSNLEEMKGKFAKMAIKENCYYDIYLIGGNASSTAPGDLLDVILEAIPKIFKRSCIEREYLNLKGDKNYISVNMQMNGVLTFCKHD